MIKPKCYDLLNMQSEIWDQKYQSVYLSEPIYFIHFNVRHPVPCSFSVQNCKEFCSKGIKAVKNISVEIQKSHFHTCILLYGVKFNSIQQTLQFVTHITVYDKHYSLWQTYTNCDKHEKRQETKNFLWRYRSARWR